LPLDREYPGGLVITGDESKSLDEAELNQYVMYHMNLSLGQGMFVLSQRTLLPRHWRQRRWARPEATRHLDVADV
jgi:hypothetical protein